jgi:DnaJ-class molecular chaperone
MQGSNDCTICNGTGRYINSRGIDSNTPCNECDPKGWHDYLVRTKIRKPNKEGAK